MFSRDHGDVKPVVALLIVIAVVFIYIAFNMP